MSDQHTRWILEMADKVSSPATAATKAVDGTANAVEDLNAAVDDMGKKAGAAQGKFAQGQKKVTDAVEESAKSAKKASAIDMYAIGNSVRELNQGITEFTAPGKAFQSELLEVSAITGASGKTLELLGESARDTAKEFGGDSAAQLDSYKTILSRLGPDLAKSPEAIDSMGKSIQTLSKTMSGDAVGATDALTTSMLQYQVDLANPIDASREMARMMNVMAAGAKEGAAEVPQIGQALEQSGVQAKLANLSFEEANAAVQALATGGKYGSEAGVGLRNFLTQISATGTLSKDAKRYLAAYHVDLKKISDTSVPFAERLRMLQPIQNDLNALTEVFGRENAANAQILIRSANEQAALTEKITGTNVATEQATIVMGGYEERMKRWGAFIDDIGISVFNATETILPFVQGGADAISMLANLKNAQQGITMITQLFTKATWFQTIATNAASAAQWLLNAAFYASPLGWVALAIGAVVGAVIWAWNTFEGFRGVLYGVWEATKAVFGGIGDFVGDVLSGIWGLLKGVFNPANWFNDSYSFSAELGKITNAAAKYGEAIGKGFEAGKAKGVASFREDNKEETGSNSFSIAAATGSGGAPAANKNVIVPAGSGGKGGKGLEITGSGSGGGKSIVMHLSITNHFGGINSALDIRKVADEVVGRINDKLRENVVTL